MAKLTWTLLFTLFISLTTGQRDFPNRGPKGTSQIISWLSKHSDRRVRPGADSDELVVVTVNILITNFRSLGEEDMSFSFDAIIHTKWNDSRIKYTEGPPRIVLPPDEGRKLLWVPDIYIANSKANQLHGGLAQDAGFTIKSNGDVAYSYRTAVQVHCSMNLQHFPLDTQTCSVHFQSYINTEDDVMLEWDMTSPVEVHPSSSMPAFRLLKVHHGVDTDVSKSGNYTRLFAEFSMKRIPAHYFILTYIPSILLVAFSCLLFWLPSNTNTWRSYLGVGLLLGMTIVLASSQYASPQVGYIKALDVWVVACFAFIMVALLGHSLIQALSARPSKPASLEHFELIKADEPEGFPADLVSPPGGDRKSNRSSSSGHTTVPSKASSRLSLAFRVLYPLAFILFNAIYWASMAS